MHRLAALSVLLLPSLAHAHGVHPHLREDTFAMGAAFALATAVFFIAVTYAGRKSARLAPES
jgi:hypothetical protein